MAAPLEILELVARFRQQIDPCKSGEYNAVHCYGKEQSPPYHGENKEKQL